MSDPDLTQLPLSQLEPQEKAQRASSFGAVASHYERYRPGPPRDAVSWLLPSHLGTVVDLGAGTGALTRLLIGRADEVIAVEPDDRMREVLTKEVPGARALPGRGDAMPLDDGAAHAVLASSSWHWMDLIPTLHEMARILVPGGMLAALWSGPDPEGPFLVQALALLAGRAKEGGDDDNVAGLVMGESARPTFTLEIPPGVPFSQPEQKTFSWNVALTADDLIGLLGTLSWIITLPDETRVRVIAEARQGLDDLLGIKGDVTVDVAFRCDAYRCTRDLVPVLG